MAVLTNHAKESVINLLETNNDFARSLENFKKVTSNISKDKITIDLRRGSKKFGFRKRVKPEVGIYNYEDKIRSGITKLSNDIYMYKEKKNRILFTIAQGPEGKDTVIVLGASDSIKSIENMLK